MSKINEIFAFLDGKAVTLDGVHGVFRHEYRDLLRQRLTHVPSAVGKRSAEYAACRAFLGDDYVSDLTDSIEGYVQIAIDLGYLPSAESVV